MIGQVLTKFEITTVLWVVLGHVFLGGLTLILVLTGNLYLSRRELRHLRRLGQRGVSGLADQFDARYEKEEGAAQDEPIIVKALYIYPIKSCAPIGLQRALLTKTGFAYDRCFALAVEANPGEWQFISQRTKPRMSLVKQELWLPDEQSSPDDRLVQAGGCLIVSFPNPDAPNAFGSIRAMFEARALSAVPHVRFVVPLLPSASQTRQWGLQLKPFTIHSRQASGLDFGQLPPVAAALPKLKRFLKIPERQRLTLMRCTPDTLVRTTRNLAPLNYIGTPAVHGYTDQQPVHVINLPSVHATSKLLPRENRPLDALRFRANIYCAGAPAFSEETWKRYRIIPRSVASGLRKAKVAPVFSVVCRTSRCTMPNVIPEKGVFEEDTPRPEKKRGRPQPSTTLVKYRTVENGNPAALGYLGMHCVPEDSSLKEAVDQILGLYVEVGDEIAVLERGNHLYGSTGDDY
ncbi:hypothetical protein PV08_06957 [Exophiala spinifera]|uniref:MOSC domain-containing protein n=1 Tax=Exophiala spinifera TaxID=91928 RepID=A0A0D1YGR0_9EURO|nr:uncharacterized protein PV08_06957 [Exophiala spinifera]KIW14176.1 hypothetical protein PV08_06957 [Exophiala spinifera]